MSNQNTAAQSGIIATFGITGQTKMVARDQQGGGRDWLPSRGRIEVMEDKIRLVNWGRVWDGTGFPVMHYFGDLVEYSAKDIVIKEDEISFAHYDLAIQIDFSIKGISRIGLPRT